MTSRPAELRVGIDFDNTIITYDEVFRIAARRDGLVDDSFKGCKQEVRDAIRLLPGGEFAWQRLQGQVYGKGIVDAAVMSGFESFLRRCKLARCTVAIISHKTEFGHHDRDRVNLREAALNWMAAQGLLDEVHGISPDSIYFEDTRSEKLRRIAALGLAYFIDDLKEVLTDPGFPPSVTRILFANSVAARSAPYIVCRTWQEIERQIFGGAGH